MKIVPNFRVSILGCSPGYETPKLSCRQAHLLLVYDHLALWTPLPRTQTSALLLLQLLYESFAGRRTPASRGFPNPLHQGGVFGNSGTGYETPKLSCRQAHLLLV